MNNLSAIGLTVFAISAVSGCGRHALPDITEQELVRRTQELDDALVPGNQEPWKKYFADDATYFDEKGRAMDKAALVKEVEPMPTGYSGTIKVINAKSHFLGDTAILSYDLDETETIFGQVEKARYHGTDTWVRRNGQWQIVAGQMLRYYEDPAPGVLDRARAAESVGIYELTSGTQRTVTLEANTLFMQRTGRPKEELIPEGSDIFFRKGVEGRIVFRHTMAGQADVLIDRRNNEDVVWKLIK